MDSPELDAFFAIFLEEMPLVCWLLEGKNKASVLRLIAIEEYCFEIANFIDLACQLLIFQDFLMDFQ